MLKSLVLIFSLLFMGEVLIQWSNFSIPGSVIGMLLAILLLLTKWVQPKDFKPTSDVLLKNLALFFVPPGVGLIQHFDLLVTAWPVILIASVVSTLVVLAVTGGLQQTKKEHA